MFFHCFMKYSFKTAVLNNGNTMCSYLFLNFFMIIVIRNEESIEMCNYEGNILSNCWTIDCKYYTADINLCTSNSLNELSEQFIRNIDAMIILFNVEKVNLFNNK